MISITPYKFLHKVFSILLVDSSDFYSILSLRDKKYEKEKKLNITHNFISKRWVKLQLRMKTLILSLRLIYNKIFNESYLCIVKHINVLHVKAFICEEQIHLDDSWINSHCHNLSTRRIAKCKYYILNPFVIKVIYSYTFF